MTQEYYSHVWWSFYKCWLPEMNHEILYQLCQLTFLEKKRCYSVLTTLCVTFGPFTITINEEINWGMIEKNCIFSVLLNLCTLLHLIKSQWTWSLKQAALYIICLQGHIREQKMIRACNKHPVVSFTTSLGLYHVVCSGSIEVQALIVKIFMPETRTCYKYENIYIYCRYTGSWQNAMLFGVSVLSSFKFTPKLIHSNKKYYCKQ